MYPYVAASQLPWFLSSSKPVFRVRRSNEWLMGLKMGPVDKLDGEGTLTKLDDE
jgi:hypothetical protein